MWKIQNKFKTYLELEKISPRSSWSCRLSQSYCRRGDSMHFCGWGFRRLKKLLLNRSIKPNPTNQPGSNGGCNCSLWHCAVCVCVCKVTNDETNLFLLPSSPTFSSSWSVGTRLFRLDFLGTVGMLMRKENRGKCRLSLLAPSVVEFKGMTKLFNYRKDTKIAQLCRHVCLTAKGTFYSVFKFQPPFSGLYWVTWYVGKGTGIS